MTAVRLKARGLWTTFQEPLRELQPFRTYGALQGDRYAAGEAPRVESTGELGNGWRHVYDRDWPFIDYVVWSYRTPLAWHARTHVMGSFWVMPSEYYSRTTSAHRSKIYLALAESGSRPVRFRNEHPYREAVADGQHRTTAMHRSVWAPPELHEREVPTNSGEGAIYSPEYLAKNLRQDDRARLRLARLEPARD